MHRVDAEQQRAERSDEVTFGKFPDKNKNQENVEEMDQEIGEDISRRIEPACGIAQRVGKNGYRLIIAADKGNRGKNPDNILHMTVNG